MLFSSLIFLFAFLPLVLFAVLISKQSWHNLILLLASLFFYAWGGVSYTVLLLSSILINYLTGLGIDRYRDKKQARSFLITGLILNLLLLIIFKYANFLADNLNLLLQKLQLPTIELEAIDLPIGISFFTFQAISYIVDVYIGRTEVQKKLHHLALYISLFPQLIAGPIVRYHDIAAQLKQRTIGWAKLSSGIERFIIGLGKKVLLANNFALLADEIFAIAPEHLDPLSAWVGVICYSLQIYFDFSGYSDMAIGLGRMFGFEIPENFNFPYIARSIREFWRRWHISLSQWFRDYLYIPLGGNRLSSTRTYVNLLIVFFLTGLWHGASWTFVFWGLYHGFFMILERSGLGRLLEKVWQPLAHLYALLVVMIGWVFFRAEHFSYAWDYCKALFGLTKSSDFQFDLAYYFNYEFILVLVVGLLAASNMLKWLNQKLEEWLEVDKLRLASIFYQGFSTIFLLLIFFYCTMNLVNSSYNPFIYFRF